MTTRVEKIAMHVDDKGASIKDDTIKWLKDRKKLPMSMSNRRRDYLRQRILPNYT